VESSRLESQSRGLQDKECEHRFSEISDLGPGGLVKKVTAKIRALHLGRLVWHLQVKTIYEGSLLGFLL
jgi:hypothetical protein